jgi:hypothetical protein
LKETNVEERGKPKGVAEAAGSREVAGAGKSENYNLQFLKLKKKDRNVSMK